MKNVLKLIFSSLLVFPFTMNAQQQDFPAGTTPNEHNINGADYPRIGEDRRVHFRIHAPNAQKVEISFRGEMTKEADGYWSLVSGYNRRSKCRRSQWQTVLRYGQMGKRY